MVKRGCPLHTQGLNDNLLPATRTQSRPSYRQRFGILSVGIQHLANESLTPKTAHPMSKSISTREDEITADLLNESVLRAASKVGADIIAPEETRMTSEVTTWNESPNTLGHHTPDMPVDPEMIIAEQLVTAGAEEAEIEKRSAATSAA